MTAIRKAVARYLALRRGFGSKLRIEGCWLEKFASFLEERRSHRVTVALALQWATQANAQPVHIARRLSVVRRFALYQAAHDPQTEVPAPGLIPLKVRRGPPYIYTDEQLARLLAAARQLPSTLGLRRETYATLLGLLMVTGMRIGEAVNLDRSDVDLENAILTVRQSKFGKSRLIPIHASTCRALACYARARDQSLPRQETTTFLVGEHGRRLTVNVTEKTFVKLSRKVGLRKPSDKFGPRLHDLRHRFAITTLLNFYHCGVDVERQLPRLSTYLGHVHPTDTYWYLTAVPELMAAAASRLEKRPGERAT